MLIIWRHICCEISARSGGQALERLRSCVPIMQVLLGCGLRSLAVLPRSSLKYTCTFSASQKHTFSSSFFPCRQPSGPYFALYITLLWENTLAHSCLSVDYLGMRRVWVCVRKGVGVSMGVCEYVHKYISCICECTSRTTYMRLRN